MAYIQSPFTYGNKKLPDHTAIFNITSAANCPAAALGLCSIEHRCYAKRYEKYRPQITKTRQRQTTFFDHCSVKDFVRYINPSAIYLRISESGDFRSQTDVQKISDIADALIPDSILVYGYTARHDLDFSRLSSNLVLNGSGFMIHNQFTAVADTSDVEGFVCPSNCRICNVCTRPRGRHIFVKIH
jgi:hypothetical protein